MTKYCNDSSCGHNGFTDDKTVLEAADDAASYNWHSDWRMPTAAEWQELDSSCTWTWTTRDGHNGYLVTGPNGNTIFLPATGYRDSYLMSDGTDGNYWSSSLYTTVPSGGQYFTFYEGYHNPASIRYRFYGCTIRPVFPLE